MTVNLYNSSKKVEDNQYIYDAFNDFIFSQDRNVFNKMMFRSSCYFSILEDDVPGDIVECGVFKGSGLATWLKLKQMSEPNTIRKVIGFDYFSDDFVDDIENESDKNCMKQVFSRDTKIAQTGFSIDFVNENLQHFGDDYLLIQGDVSQTSAKYVSERPGAKIAILYLDMDMEKPTYDAFVNFYPLLSSGSMVVFDEYGYHGWTETKAVDRILEEYDLKLTMTNIKAPSAYVVIP